MNAVSCNCGVIEWRIDNATKLIGDQRTELVEVRCTLKRLEREMSDLLAARDRMRKDLRKLRQESPHMNAKEFAALKVGDRIENLMAGTAGTITAVNDAGCHVRWDSERRMRLGDAPGNVYHYSVTTTAWMHWTREETATAGEHT